MTAFEHHLAALDTTLFDPIPAQLTDGDKQSLLAVQKALRELSREYVYLEIGSHLGGSIQTHLRDPRCARIYSIDKRPELQADDRGYTFAYPENSTADMMDRLRNVAGDRTAIIRCFDMDASRVPPQEIDPRPHLCLIDGEHTEKAALSDYAFCRSVIDGNGVVLFHDANVIYSALARVVRELEAAGTPFHAYALPSSVFVLELGDAAIHRAEAVGRMLVDNHVQYLHGLLSLDHYREVYNRPVMRLVRSAWHAVLRVTRAFRPPTPPAA